MTRWGDGRQPRGRAASAPSAVARDRLASRVEREVADVRVRLEEAVLRSDAFLAAGHPERAAEVVDEQHALLEELRTSVEASIAAAAAEAEAERVLARAPDADRMLGEQRDDGRAPSLPTAIGAGISAVAMVIALVAVGPPPELRGLAAAGSDGAVEEPAPSPRSGADRRAGRADAAAAADGSAEARAEDARDTAGRADGRGGPDAGAGIAGSLQALVGQLLASVARAADLARAVALEQVELPRGDGHDADRDGTEAPADDQPDDVTPAQPDEEPSEPEDGASEADAGGTSDGDAPEEEDGGLPVGGPLEERVDDPGIVAGE